MDEICMIPEISKTVDAVTENIDVTEREGLGLEKRRTGFLV